MPDTLENTSTGFIKCLKNGQSIVLYTILLLYDNRMLSDSFYNVSLTCCLLRSFSKVHAVCFSARFLQKSNYNLKTTRLSCLPR